MNFNWWKRSFGKAAQRSPLQGRRNRARLWLEVLESRLVPATQFVNNAWNLIADNGTAGVLDNGDIVRNDNDAIAPGTITATVGAADGAFGVVTTSSVPAGPTGPLPGSTINSAIAAAAPSDTIRVAAGTYAENVVVTKAVTLLGQQAGVSSTTRFAAFVTGANGPKASPSIETIITPPTSDPISANPGANDLVRVLASNVTFDGFVLDGNNPAIVGPSVTQTTGGVDIDARRGLTNTDAAGAVTAIDHLSVQNDILQNFGERGISLAGTGAASSGNVIAGTLVRSFGWASGQSEPGIALFSTFYADLTGNTVDAPDAATGIAANTFLAAGSMIWTSNTVTVGADGIGIQANNFVGAGIVLNANNNIVNAATGVATPAADTWGFYVLSIDGGAVVSLLGNTVGGAGGQFSRGINLWNLTASTPVVISGGSVARSDVGIDLDAVDFFFGAATGTSTAAITGVTVTGGTTGILVRSAVVNAISPAGSVQANVIGGSVTGAATSLLVEDNVSDAFTVTVTQTATSTYDGAVTVNASTLYVNGVLAGAGPALAVNTGGTLGGTGTVQRSVSVNSGSTLSPGVSGPGILATAGLTLQPGSTFLVDLNGPAAGSDYDRVNVTGAVNLTGATLQLQGGFTPTPGAVVTLITNDGADVVGAGFAGLADGAPVSAGTFSGFLTYQDNDGNDLTLAALGPVSFTAGPAGSSLVLKRSGVVLQLLNVGVIVDSRPLAAITDYNVTGADNAPDSLTLDLSGGFYSLSGTVFFAGGVGTGDSLAATGGAVTFTEVQYLGSDSVSLGLSNGGPVLYAGAFATESINLGGITPVVLRFELTPSGDTVALTDGGDAALSTLISSNGTFAATTFRDPTSTLNLNAGAGSDGIGLTRLNPTAAVFVVDAQAGNNALSLDVSATNFSDTVFLTANALHSDAMVGNIYYVATGGTYGAGLFVKTGATFADRVYVLATAPGAPTEVQTGGGDDTITVSSSLDLSQSQLASLAAVLGVDAGAGANQLLVSDAGHTGANTLWLSAQGISGDADPFTIFYKATGGTFANGIVLIASQGNDTVNVLSQLSGSPTTVYGFGGSDTINVAVTPTSAYANLAVDGGAGVDTLVVFDQTGTATARRRLAAGTFEILYPAGVNSLIFFANVEQTFANVPVTDVP